MRVTGFMLILLCMPLTTFAQTAAVTRIVDAVVLDESGMVVTDLTPDSFTLLENGQPHEIRNFSGPDTPWNVIVLLDYGIQALRTSPANAVRSPRPMLMKGVEAFLSNLRVRDRVLIAAFNDQVEVLMDWRTIAGRGSQEVKVKEPTQRVQGARDFYGALEWAARKLKGTAGRKLVIVFTDGRDGRLAPQWFMNADRLEVFDPLFGLADTGEAEEFRQTSDAIRASGVRFHFVAVDANLPPELNGRPLNELFPGTEKAAESYAARVRSRIETLASVSGGSVTYGRLDQGIAVLQRLYQDQGLGALYTIEYDSASGGDLPPAIQIQMKERKLRARHSVRR